MGSNVYRVDNDGVFKGLPDKNFTDAVDEKILHKSIAKGKGKIEE